MNEKAAHVLAAKQTRVHACHWPGCTEQVPPALWGCPTHWFRLPSEIRNRIWRHYKPGQEESFLVSEEYLAAAKAAQAWIRDHGEPDR